MTVQPIRDWAASTESMVFVSQILSQSPSQALQNMLGGGGGGLVSVKVSLRTHTKFRREDARTGRRLVLNARTQCFSTMDLSRLIDHHFDEMTVFFFLLQFSIIFETCGNLIV